MWPQTLQMTEDDCRSTLRRLELETYANVIGVFRAQGGLSDKKVKLLEELRNVFHISQDRHRAEARRVANDEHLSTIAKVVSGPNTWQEWSREGRRSYPMLPRVAPQTALNWVANNLAAEAALENAKLPYPAETAAAALEEQTSILDTNAAAEPNGFRYSDKYVVKSDPFKMPDIPTVGAKKNLKRGISDAHQSFGFSSSKKRNINESLSGAHKLKHANAISSAVSSPTTSNSNSRKAISLSKLQQQRFFYQQQQKAKKLAKNVSGKREKLLGVNKAGRKSKKFKEQLNQQIILEDELLHHDYIDRSYDNQLMHEFRRYDSSSTNNAGIMDDVAAQQQYHEQNPNQHIDMKFNNNAIQQQQNEFYMPMTTVQQIAAAGSKRDVTRNLTKLNANANRSLSVGQLESVPAVQNQPQISSPTAHGSQIIIGNKTVVDGKLAQLSTPVQKYIVEDRQPPPTSSPSACLSGGQQQASISNVSAPNKLRALNATTILAPGTKLSTSAKKLSGAILLSPDGGGHDLNLNSNSNATAQLYSLLDGGDGGGNTGSSSGGGGGGGGGNTVSNISSNSSNLLSPHAHANQQQISTGPSPPTHTPPAVIQLHSNEVVRVGTQQSSATPTSSTQSKVLTTKILPIVLSGNKVGGGGGVTSKNGNAAVAVSSSNFISGGSGCPPTSSTIIKTLPSSLFVSGQNTGMTSGSGSPVFSTFSSSGPVYRKHPNILKSTSSTNLSRNTAVAASSGGPQIISNIRLTPAITTGTGGTTNSQQTQSGIFQQPLRSGTVGGSTTSGIRTSVKICQSPNGKVFIQPANMDTSKLTKLSSGHIAQRIIPGTLFPGANTSLSSGSSGSSSTNQPSSPHRIAIQKVQIIPAPNALGGTTHTNLTIQQQQQQRQSPSSSLSIGTGTGGNFTSSGTKGNLSGNIFVPTGSGGLMKSAKTSSGAITLAKANFSNTCTSRFQNDIGSLVGKQHTQQDMGTTKASSNVVVIDASAASSSSNNIISHHHHSKLSGNISRSDIDNSQMITEDTPVDIIVENSSSIAATESSAAVNETSSITAVLASKVLDDVQHSKKELLATTTTKHRNSSTHSSSSNQMPITVLNATDWEMELDQATAANLSQQNQHQSRGDSMSRQFNKRFQQHNSHLDQTETTGETIIIDDNYEDVIIEEEEEQDETNASVENYDDDKQDTGQDDMDIEVANDNGIIIVDNLHHFDEKTQSDCEKVQHERKEFEDEDEDEVYRPVSPNSEHRFDDTLVISSEDDDNTIDKQAAVPNVKTYKNIVESKDLSTSKISECENAFSNSHEENEQARRERESNEDHKICRDAALLINDKQYILQNKLMNAANAKRNSTTANMEESKTMISGSLFSVKDDVQDSIKIESDEESSLKGTHHCSSKSDSVHSSNQ